MQKNRVRYLLLLAALFAMLLVPFGAGAQGTMRSEVVASGLDNPRGMAFGPDGALYVAEAGRGGDGPCVTGAEGETCYGDSGAITKIMVDSRAQERIVSNMPSLGLLGNEMIPPGSNATGPHDIAFDNAGNLMTILGLGFNPSVRDTGGILAGFGEDFGKMIMVDSVGNWTVGDDVAGHEGANDPDGAGADSNPFGMIYDGSSAILADSGGNTLVEVSPDRAISTIAVFPASMATWPPGSDSMIPMQSVPTRVVKGPDGAYYVGELSGFPFEVGSSEVYRVMPGSEPTVYEGGFIHIMDLAFDANGTLYVLEMATNGLLSQDLTGALWKVTPDRARVQIGEGTLFAPTGMTIGPDGSVYVSNNGLFPGVGEVVRFTPPELAVGLNSAETQTNLWLLLIIPAFLLLAAATVSMKPSIRETMQ